MNWQTRLFTETRVGEDPENTILYILSNKAGV
jgi:hypothetical protein